MVVVGPGVAPGTRSQVIGNVDLAPTFESIAGLTPSTERAGWSFLPTLQSPSAPSSTYTFFEHTYSNTNPDTDPDYDSDVGGSSVTLPGYLAIRSKDALLVRWDLDKSYRGVDYASRALRLPAQPLRADQRVRALPQRAVGAGHADQAAAVSHLHAGRVPGPRAGPGPDGRHRLTQPTLTWRVWRRFTR